MKQEDFLKRFARFLSFGLIILACRTTLTPSISASQSLSPTPSYTPQPTESPTFTPPPPRPQIKIENVNQIALITTLTPSDFNLESFTMSGVAWSPDGTKLAIPSYETIIVETNTWSEILRFPNSSSELSWSPDGTKLAMASSGLQVWDIVQNKEVFTYQIQDNFLFNLLSVSWSPNAEWIAAGSDGDSQLVLIWDATTGKKIQELQDIYGAVWGVAWSPDSSKLAVGGQDDQIIIYDTSNWNQEMILKSEYTALYSLSWSPNGAYLASNAAQITHIKIWDTKSSTERLDFGGGLEVNNLWEVIWSPDGSMLASAGSIIMGDLTVPIIDIWDADTGKLITTLFGLDEPEFEGSSYYGQFMDVDWSLDGARLAAMSSNGVVYVWGLPEEK